VPTVCPGYFLSATLQVCLAFDLLPNSARRVYFWRQMNCQHLDSPGGSPEAQSCVNSLSLRLFLVPMLLAHNFPCRFQFACKTQSGLGSCVLQTCITEIVLCCPEAVIPPLDTVSRQVDPLHSTLLEPPTLRSGCEELCEIRRVVAKLLIRPLFLKHICIGCNTAEHDLQHGDPMPDCCRASHHKDHLRWLET
jgi:hypothetical protein